MKAFRYVAIDASGRTVRGEQNAESEPDLEARLARQQMELLSVRPAARQLRLFTRRLAAQDLINLLVHVQTLTQAGVPLLETLVDLRDSSDASTIKSFAADLVDRIEGGATLSQAMSQSPWPLDPVIISLVQTGEATGKLPEVMGEIVESLKWTDEINSQTRKLLRTPAFTFVVVMAAVLFLMLYLVPQLLVFIRSIGGEIPLQTRALMWLSSALATYWWVVVSAPVLAWFGLRSAARASPAWRERIDTWKLTTPPVGPVLKKVILARFANSFALMYRSGVSVLDAIAFCKGLSPNAAYQASLDRALRSISDGQRISDAFAALPLFPPLVVRMLRVGENTGSLDKALGNVSYFYQREVKDSVEKLQAAIQPALTIFLGGMVAWIMSAVILPIYDVISKVKF